MGATEGFDQPTPMGAVLHEGLDTISQEQVVEFTRYDRMILPLDGFAFWVRAGIINRQAMLYVPFSMLYDPSALTKFEAKGSLHYSTDNQQNADESFGFNRVVFTAQEAIEELNDVNPNSIWIGTIDNIRFAFDRRTSFYRQADLWHYEGDAIYPAMATQIIDNGGDLDLTRVVVSNSLPIWLALNSIAPVYPAFLLPDNLPPPYVSIDVQNTWALASAPLLDDTLSHYQLAKDQVRVTTYGLRNDQIMDYVDMVNSAMLNEERMGLLNMPIPVDVHRGQNELNILAQKKAIDYEVSYVQTNLRAYTRKLILEAIIDVIEMPL